MNDILKCMAVTVAGGAATMAIIGTHFVPYVFGLAAGSFMSLYNELECTENDRIYTRMDMLRDVTGIAIGEGIIALINSTI